MSQVAGAVRRWFRDVAFGIRLAARSESRVPWARLALTAVGIGLGVAVLLLASSIQNIDESRQERVATRGVDTRVASEKSSPRNPELLALQAEIEFRGDSVGLVLLDPLQADAPVAPGLSRNPKPGEVFVSPALKRILDGPDGDLLRPRVGGNVIGVMGNAGLASPGELFFYGGVDNLRVDDSRVGGVEGSFANAAMADPELDSAVWFFLLLGVTALLVPVVVFVASTTRLAEAARQRRLAALRLVGASGKQVRRIAVGEALIGSILGLIVGWVLFLVGRQVAGSISVVGFSVFPSDIWPVWWCAVLLCLAIPIVALSVSIGSMQRTIIEPLGVVRQIRSGRRRLGWRCAPIVLGVGGLLLGSSGPVVSGLLVVSVAMILVGVPLILSWVVERVVDRLGGGGLPWQLAVRRLQLTSGTAARSVSVIAVVLTGVIGLQTFAVSIAGQGSTLAAEEEREPHGIQIRAEADRAGIARNIVNDLKAVRGVHTAAGYELIRLKSGEMSKTAAIVDCQMLANVLQVRHCRGGEAFYLSTGPEDTEPPVRSDRHWVFGSSPAVLEPQQRVRYVQAPENAHRLRDVIRSLPGTLLITPSPITSTAQEDRTVVVEVDMTSRAPEAGELVRNIAAEHLFVPSVWDESATSDEQEIFAGIRYGLLLGMLVTFVLIGCGLFVTAIEQIQERRRQMAVLGAVGVRRSDLGWSVLLQNMIPMAAAIAVSVVLGLGLGALVVLMSNVGVVRVDFGGILALVTVAILSVLVVTGLSLPAVGRAMHPEGLRTE